LNRLKSAQNKAFNPIFFENFLSNFTHCTKNIVAAKLKMFKRKILISGHFEDILKCFGSKNQFKLPKNHQNIKG